MASGRGSLPLWQMETHDVLMEIMRCLFRIAIWRAILMSRGHCALDLRNGQQRPLARHGPDLSLDGSSTRLTKIAMKTQGAIEPDEESALAAAVCAAWP